MKRPLRIFLILAFAYLVITFAVGAFAEFMYRWNLAGNLAILGKRAFADTRAIQALVDGDLELRRLDGILKFTPPMGWIFLRRINGVGDAVLYASKNYALPVDQRFVDADEARSYGFDPTKKSEMEIGDATMKRVW